mmetsp:Transcript_33174/g.87752  ORF Transcript_33174/g.87752 Transcript_33174/m.87752 type:complete len:138 (+) Transcript_33174:852-1265(+)
MVFLTGPLSIVISNAVVAISRTFTTAVAITVAIPVTFPLLDMISLSVNGMTAFSLMGSTAALINLGSVTNIALSPLMSTTLSVAVIMPPEMLAGDGAGTLTISLTVALAVALVLTVAQTYISHFAVVDLKLRLTPPA